MKIDLSLPEQIIILQKRKGVSTEDMAALLDVSPQNYSRRLRLNSFSSAELEQIAKLLGCTIGFHPVSE